MRLAAWVSPTENTTDSTRYKREHYSSWHRVSCPEWDDTYEGSTQPVTCTVSWFSRPGMVIALIGYLMAIAAGCVWLCGCSINKGTAHRQKTTASVVLLGGILLFVGWIVVLMDTSLKDLIPADALPLPDGSPAEEKLHESRWWFGLLCGPFFGVFGALIWFFRGRGRRRHYGRHHSHRQDGCLRQTAVHASPAGYAHLLGRGERFLSYCLLSLFVRSFT